MTPDPAGRKREARMMFPRLPFIIPFIMLVYDRMKPWGSIRNCSRRKISLSFYP